MLMNIVTNNFMWLVWCYVIVQNVMVQAILDKFVEGWIVQWWNQKHVGLLVVDAAEANRLMADVIMCWVLCCDAVSVWCHYVLSIVLWVCDVIMCWVLCCEHVMSLCAEYCAVSVWCHYVLSIVLWRCERVMSLCAEYCAATLWAGDVIICWVLCCDAVSMWCHYVLLTATLSESLYSSWVWVLRVTECVYGSASSTRCLRTRLHSLRTQKGVMKIQMMTSLLTSVTANVLLIQQCIQFVRVKLPLSAVTLLVGRQVGHPACKKLCVGLLVVMIWLELCTTDNTCDAQL